MKMPSPRFSIAGNQVGRFNAILATRLVSAGDGGNMRVKPQLARTSRKRVARVTLLIHWESSGGAGDGRISNSVFSPKGCL